MPSRFCGSSQPRVTIPAARAGAVVDEHRGQVRRRAVVDRHPQPHPRRAAEADVTRQRARSVDEPVRARARRALDQHVVGVELAPAVDERLLARAPRRWADERARGASRERAAEPSLAARAPGAGQSRLLDVGAVLALDRRARLAVDPVAHAEQVVVEPAVLGPLVGRRARRRPARRGRRCAARSCAGRLLRASRYHHSANAFVLTLKSFRPWTTNTLARIRSTWPR